MFTCVQTAHQLEKIYVTLRVEITYESIHTFTMSVGLDLVRMPNIICRNTLLGASMLVTSDEQPIDDQLRQ